MTPRAAAFRFSLWYGAYFASVGVYQPFMPVWLTAHGLSPAEIGALFSTLMWIRIFSNPTLTQVADRRGARKGLILTLAFIGSLPFALLPLANGFWPVLLFLGLHIALYAPVLPLSDSLVLMTARERGLDYGRMRLWGSITFILASTGAGWVLTGRDPDWVIAMVGATLALIFLVGLLLPDIRTAPAAKHSRPVRGLLREPLFLVFVLTSATNMASHAVLNGFSTLHWRALGHGDDAIGVLWAVGTITEVALFAFARPAMDRLGVVGLFMLGAAAGLVRWSLTAHATAYWALLLIQPLHALTFGATHLAAMGFIQRAVPAEMASTAQGLYSSLSMGLVVGLTMMLAGRLYGAFGGDAFLFMTVLSGASLGLAFLLGRIWRGRTLSATVPA